MGCCASNRKDPSYTYKDHSFGIKLHDCDNPPMATMQLTASTILSKLKTAKAQDSSMNIHECLEFIQDKLENNPTDSKIHHDLVKGLIRLGFNAEADKYLGKKDIYISENVASGETEGVPTEGCIQYVKEYDDKMSCSQKDDFGAFPEVELEDVENEGNPLTGMIQCTEEAKLSSMTSKENLRYSNEEWDVDYIESTIAAEAVIYSDENVEDVDSINNILGNPTRFKTGITPRSSKQWFLNMQTSPP